MDESRNAKVEIDLEGGKISIQGSEEFVEKNMITVLEFVQSAKKEKVNLPINDEKDKDSVTDTAMQSNRLDSAEGNNMHDQYKSKGIYSVDENGNVIAIHRKIPGTSNAEKMKNIALISLYERETAIDGLSIKELCTKHSCWDGKNASKIFDKEYGLFLKKKVSTKKWTIELTFDGQQAAANLLEEMANASK